jgi:hypothetical protein
MNLIYNIVTSDEQDLPLIELPMVYEENFGSNGQGSIFSTQIFATKDKDTGLTAENSPIAHLQALRYKVQI